MKLKFLILFIFSCSLFYRASAQQSGELTQSRILFLLDESSSMLQSWSNDRPKYKMANQIIDRLMDSIHAVNPGVQFSLRVFGNQHTVPEHDCYDTKNEVPFSPDNRTQMSFRLDDMRPLGVTAIAYSLSEAAEKDLVDETHNAYSIILITDGGESCNGDICGVMDKLIRNKVFFKPYVLSLEDVPELKTEYACLGSYLAVTKPADITKAVNLIVDAFRPMLVISKVEYQKMQVIASKAPSALKVNLPAIKVEEPEVAPAPPKPAKPVDTVATKPKSNIVVDELPKRPAPLTLKKVKPGKPVPFFVARHTFRPVPAIAVPVPDIKISEEDIIHVIPAPVKLATIRRAELKRRPVAKAVFADPQALSVPLPELKIELPPVRPAPLTLARVSRGTLRRLPVSRSTPAPLPTLVAQLPEIKEVVPEKRAVIKLESIAVTGLKKFNTSKPTFKTPKSLKVEMPVINIPDEEPVAPPKPVVVRTPLKLPKVKMGKFRMHLLYVNTFLDSDVKPMKVPPLPEVKLPPAPPVPVTVTKPAPGKPTPGKPATPAPIAKTGEYKIEREDAPETTLEVYFTNGKGKFYATTPRVFLLDPVNGKEIKRFFRTVDESGNPDPITNLAVGKYDLTVAGRDDLLAHVDMQPGKRNKVYIKVKDYSLYFYYDDAPNRPVKEYSATVIQRNTANGKVTLQKCTEKLEYEPGNYHIVINTFPEDIRNVDLDAMAAGGIAIPQPGFVKFTSEVSTNTVTLFRELGDKFIQFATINLSDPRTLHLPIQPGKYQAHYSNGTTKYSTSDRVISFQITGTQETEVVLVK